MSIVNTLALESNRQIKINFDGGDLSSDAGLLLIKEFISKLGIDTVSYTHLDVYKRQEKERGDPRGFQGILQGSYEEVQYPDSGL